jgi:hypothetical protein
MCIFLFPSLLLHSKRDECRIETTVCVVPVICVVFLLLLLLLLSLETRSLALLLSSPSSFVLINPTCNEDVRLNCIIVSIFCVFFGPNFALQSKGERFSPFWWCLFPRDFSFFFFLFLSDSEAKDRNESFSFFQRALEQALSFSSFLSFSFLSADLMRAILLYEERSGRGRVLVRENLPLERDEFAL